MAIKINKNGEDIIPKGETWISDEDFRMNKKLTSIVIPEGVTSIADGAFKGCINLRTVTIPNGVEWIGYDTFSGCKSLTSIIIPDSVGWIRSSAFYGCESLERITIPKNVELIEPGAFSGCISLNSIIVAEGNKKYDSRNNCNAIIDTESNTLLQGCVNTVIPNTVTSIAPVAFARCKDLISIDIPDSVLSIGQEAFWHCENLTSVNLSNGVEIGKDVFEGCPCMGNDKNSSATKKEKKTSVVFTYEGQLDFSIEGICSLEMSKEELKEFKRLNKQAQKDEIDDALAYFEENMTESLYNDIYNVIYQMVCYNDAREYIKNEGCDALGISQEAFDLMTEEERIESFLDENAGGECAFRIERIIIK